MKLFLIQTHRLAKSWGASFLGNYIGSVAFAYFGSYLTNSLDKDPWLTFTLKLAWTKANQVGLSLDGVV